MSISITPHKEGVVISFHVQPGAQKPMIAGIRASAIKLRVAAPPIEGKANEAVVKYLCDLLKMRTANVEIVKGLRSREKAVLFRELSDEQLGHLMALAATADN